MERKEEVVVDMEEEAEAVAKVEVVKKKERR